MSLTSSSNNLCFSSLPSLLGQVLTPWLFSKYIDLRVSLIYPNGMFVLAVLLTRVLAKSPNLHFLKPQWSVYFVVFLPNVNIWIIVHFFLEHFCIFMMFWLSYLQLNLISFFCYHIRSLCHDVTSRFWFHALSTRLLLWNLLSMTYLLGFSGGMDVTGPKFSLTFFNH